eukprot:scaffold562_cov190-Ochromonas_danica.AAC.4
MWIDLGITLIALVWTWTCLHHVWAATRDVERPLAKQEPAFPSLSPAFYPSAEAPYQFPTADGEGRDSPAAFPTESPVAFPSTGSGGEGEGGGKDEDPPQAFPTESPVAFPSTGSGGEGEGEGEGGGKGEDPPQAFPSASPYGFSTDLPSASVSSQRIVSKAAPPNPIDVTSVEKKSGGNYMRQRLTLWEQIMEGLEG